LEVCERIRISTACYFTPRKIRRLEKKLQKSASSPRVNSEIFPKTEIGMGKEWKKCSLSIYLYLKKIIKLSLDLLQDKALVVKAITILTKRYF